MTFTILAQLALGADPDGDPDDWSWTEIGDKVRQAAGGGISIHIGSSAESSESIPTQITLTLDNRDGRFTPELPTGTYYPNIKLNTPLRVLVDDVGSSPPYELARGFVDEWPPSWSTGLQDAWVTVTASGRFRRWANAESSDVLESMLRRVLEADSPVAYWPMEDGTGATSFASALGHDPMTFAGDVSPGTESALTGSRSLPVLGPGATTRAVVPTYVSTGQWLVEQTLYIPTEPAGVITLLEIATTGTVVLWRVTLTPGASTATIDVEGLNSSGTDVVAYAGGAVSDTDLYGLPLLFSVSNEQNGTSVDWTVTFGREGGTSGIGATTASVTVGIVKEVRDVANSSYDGISVGHTVVYNDTDAVTLGFHHTYLDGDPGEDAALRMSRLLTEEGVPFVTAGTGLSNTTMGPQPSDLGLLDLLRQSERADGGMLTDCAPVVVPFAVGGIFYVDLTALYNRDVDITIDLEGDQLSPPFAPTFDDRLIVNDATVFREDGSSARARDQDGPKGITEVGRRRRRYDVNVDTDAQLPHQAGWRVNVGTARGMRYPKVRLDFARNPELIQDWLDSIQVGAKIRLKNPPAEHAQDDVDLFAIGFDMFLNRFTWTVDCACVPASPYGVFEIADTTADANEWAGRLAGDDAAAIRVAIDSDDTSIQFDPNRYRWTTVADDFDPDLRVRFGGETADVSSISTTAGTFVAAGSATGADNAAVTPSLPAGVTTRDLLLIFAAIRSSGTGILQTPTGYTRLDVFPEGGNVQLFAKVHSGSESNPTVTPSGGSAGDTVTAQMAAFRGTPSTLEDLRDIAVDWATQLNGSATNIAYPGLYPRMQEGCIVLALGWRQDDATSVATLSGFTEIGDIASTDGNDQHLVWDYQIQTTPAVVNEGSFTVTTGGGAAISRSAVIALAAGYQTMTVSARSVNGTVKSHTAGTRIEVDNALVQAL